MRSRDPVLAIVCAVALAACEPASSGPEPRPVPEHHFDPAPWERAWAREELDTWREGRVVAIEPGRTLDDPTLPSIAGALVELLAPVRPGELGDPVAQVRADDDGRFRVGPGPASDWILRITAPNRSMSLVGRGAAAAAVGAFEPLPSPDGRIALRPEHVIQGRVEDASGRPLPGVRVVASSLAYSEELTSDPLGRFTAHAPGGPIHFTVRDAAYEAPPLAHAFEAGATGPVLRASPREPVRGWVARADGRRVRGATVLSVEDPSVRTTSGDDGRFELSMPRSGRVAAVAAGFGWRSLPVPRAGDVEIRIVPTPGVRGVVRDADGAPVPDARILAAALSYDGLVERVTGPRTGADGSFDFSWLPRPPRGSGAAIRLVALRRGFGECAIQAVTHFPSPLELKLLGVRDVRGRILTADGAPAAWTPIEAMWVHADGGATAAEVSVLGLAERAAAIARADGTYRIANVPLGLHAKVQCRRDGVLLERFVEGPQAAQGFDFEFPRGLPIAGRVTDAKGAVPEGAVRVMVQLLNAEGVSVTRSAVADAEGAFRFEDLPAGSYQVRADGERYDLPGGGVFPAGTADAVVKLARSAAVTLRLRFDGGEVPNVPLRLTLTPVRSRGQAFSDVIAAGRGGEPIELRGLDPGQWKLTVVGDVWRAAVDPLDLEDGEREEIDLPVRRTIRVAARLLDERGAPLPRQLVVVARADGRAEPQSAMSGEDGALDLTGLSPGRWRASAHPVGRPPLAEEFDVAAGENPPLALRLPPAGRLAVQVTAGGEPVPGAVVSLRDPAGRAVDAWTDGSQTATSAFRADDDGRVLIRGVRAGPVRVEAKSGGHVVGSRDAEIEAEKTTEVVFE